MRILRDEEGMIEVKQCSGCNHRTNFVYVEENKEWCPACGEEFKSR